jgi:hypothetical protein
MCEELWNQLWKNFGSQQTAVSKRQMAQMAQMAYGAKWRKMAQNGAK